MKRILLALLLVNCIIFTAACGAETAKKEEKVALKEDSEQINKAAGITLAPLPSIEKEDKQCKVNLEVWNIADSKFYCYDLDISFNNSCLGTVSAGGVFSEIIEVPEGEYELLVSEKGKDSNKSSTTVTVSSDMTYLCRALREKDSISFESIETTDSIEGTEVEMPSVTGMTLSDAKEVLLEKGISQIMPEPFWEVKNDSDWVVKEQNIPEGAVIVDSAAIIVKCVRADESGEATITDAEQSEGTPVSEPGDLSYYSKNEKTVKDGTTGVYAYRDEGSAYRNYYIIDLDKGYVYYFTDSEYSSSCDCCEIESGNLNTGVEITYYSEGDSWSEKLYFKQPNTPDLLIVNASDSEYELIPTRLADALAIRDTKKIEEY